jgi:hypothetical protein
MFAAVTSVHLYDNVLGQRSFLTKYISVVENV